MRLGIYGGTFDPVHYGHLLAAEQCREQCRLDQLWFIPAASPPHKQDATITSGERRADMLELAVAGMPQFAVNRMELNRQGPSYTVDTLAQLQDEDAGRELFLLIGADSVDEFPTWREPQRIAQLATLAVINRGRSQPDLSRLAECCGSREPIIVQMPGIDLSATDIRQRVRSSQSIRFMTPRAVETYLHEHRLYV